MKKFLLPLAAVLLMASGCTKEYVTKQYVTEQKIIQGMDMSLIDFEVKSENWTQRHMDNLNDDEGKDWYWCTSAWKRVSGLPFPPSAQKEPPWMAIRSITPPSPTLNTRRAR